MSRSKDTTKLISKITGELAVTTLDFVVLSAALAGGLILLGPRGKDLYAEKHLNDALKATALMYKKWDKSKFRRAIGRAVAEGFLKRVSDGFGLTETGKKHLRDLLPTYKQPQTWDGRLWLVTYDIPDDRKKTRDRFRDWLFEIGCRMIQESVWVSVKDPREWIKESVASMKKGCVIVSCLGKDGSIGNESLPELLSRVFGLKRLNKAYQNWLKSVESGIEDESRAISLGWRYLSLWRQDPALPSELLPHGWLGVRARKKFEADIEPGMGSIRTFLR